MVMTRDCLVLELMLLEVAVLVYSCVVYDSCGHVPQ